MRQEKGKQIRLADEFVELCEKAMAMTGYRTLTSFLTAAGLEYIAKIREQYGPKETDN